RRADGEGRERERRGRPRRRRAPLAHLGRGFLRLAQPLGITEPALPRGLRIPLGHFRLERLEALHVFRERGDRLVHRAGRIALQQRLEAMGAIPLAFPPQYGLAHARAPRLDRLPNRDRHVGEELPELVAAAALRRGGAPISRRGGLPLPGG